MLGLTTRPQKKEQSLSKFRDEFGALLERFFGDGGDALSDLDIEDRDNEIILRADLPGFEPDEIDTQLSGQVLTIKAEKQQQSGDGNRGERTYRFFQESLTLPEGVKADEIQAKFRNGVLEVHVPKSEQGKPKRIWVQS
jgi:HSP20 family protein